MNRLMAAGGFCLSESKVGRLERAIDSVCQMYGFPRRQEFKWSPGHELWMRKNLVGDRRFKFFQETLELARDAGAQAFVIVKDCGYARATKANTDEADVVNMCLERVCNQCGRNPPDGLVITDRSLDGHSPDDKFLGQCLESLEAQIGFLRADALCLNVLSTPSKFIRLLQIADLITGATLARVGGESTYSPPIIDVIKPMYRRSLGRIGGYGVKIHPDYRYANLYHWLFSDVPRLLRRQTGAANQMPQSK